MSKAVAVFYFQLCYEAVTITPFISFEEFKVTFPFCACDSLNILQLNVYLWGGIRVIVCMQRSESSLWESVLSCHHVNLGGELWLLGLVASSLTHGAILPASILFYFNSFISL